MTDTFLKIPSSQGGAFTASNNLMDFRIPSGDAYDLSESYLEFHTDCVATAGGDENTLTEQSIYSLVPFVKSNNSGGGAGENLYHGNEVLVKNLYLITDAGGKAEEIRRGDALYNALKQLGVDEDHSICEGYRSMAGLRGEGGDCFAGGLYAELNGLGNVKSINKSHTLKLPLKEIMELGNVENFSTAKYGNSLLHLELNLDNINVIQRCNKTNTAIDMGNNGRNTGDAQGLHSSVATPLSINKFRTSVEYPDLRPSPFYTGQALLVSATGRGATANLVNHQAIITDISYAHNGINNTGADNNDTVQSEKLIITFSPAVPTVASGSNANGYSAISVSGVDATIANDAFTLSNANLVLKRLSNPPPAPPINYTSYTTEEDVLPSGVQNFSKIYTVEPNAVNLLILFPQAIQSCMNGITSFKYRILVDNEAIHDRDITINSPEHFDNLSKYFQNQGKIVRNLMDRYGQIDKADSRDRVDIASSSQFLCVAVPIPQTAGNKLVQVNLNDFNTNIPAGMKIHLYKEVVKSI
jgi:hypothetical protein